MNATHPLAAFQRWLEWLDSHDGRLHRRKTGGAETDYDLIALLPPDRTVFTVGDLRRLITDFTQTRSLSQ